MRGNAIQIDGLKVKYSKPGKPNVKEVSQNVKMQADHLGKIADLLFWRQQSWSSALQLERTRICKYKK